MRLSERIRTAGASLLLGAGLISFVSGCGGGSGGATGPAPDVTSKANQDNSAAWGQVKGEQQNKK